VGGREGEQYVTAVLVRLSLPPSLPPSLLPSLFAINISIIPCSSASIVNPTAVPTLPPSLPPSLLTLTDNSKSTIPCKSAFIPGLSGVVICKPLKPSALLKLRGEGRASTSGVLSRRTWGGGGREGGRGEGAKYE